jgi:hypothetical protein
VNKTIAIIIAAIFLLGVIGSVLVLTAAPTTTVRIISDGEVIRTVDLLTAADETFSVTYQGHTNTIEIRDKKIRVLDADCPDHTCVNMGWLSSSSMPIVCLPHHLVIEFAGESDGLDAVTR